MFWICLVSFWVFIFVILPGWHFQVGGWVWHFQCQSLSCMLNLFWVYLFFNCATVNFILVHLCKSFTTSTVLTQVPSPVPVVFLQFQFLSIFAIFYQGCYLVPWWISPSKILLYQGRIHLKIYLLSIVPGWISLSKTLNISCTKMEFTVNF